MLNLVSVMATLEYKLQSYKLASAENLKILCFLHLPLPPPGTDYELRRQISLI